MKMSGRAVKLFVTVWVILSPVWAVVDSDDVITLDEQIYMVTQAQRNCQMGINAQIFGKQRDLMNGLGCPPEWDGLICWPRGAPNQLVSVPCPKHIYDFNHQGLAHRRCGESGTWIQVPELNRAWANYSECLMFNSPGKKLQDQNVFERLRVIYTVGYSASLAA
ncbi:parathyroid hormone parathyroid hormone-related peptide receptor-like [Pelobates cultripes]|uniref:Parathyroid hormone parathyroid hormone-related peptide receptor-like n=2 Tax=Pelobates cultripes TaxID=61616 RepID=A0AAD1WBF5_PELCU|nr:parathyroid hormone parathyroid hormone-related peptide receptor-like [Pelobates cultripes]